MKFNNPSFPDLLNPDIQNFLSSFSLSFFNCGCPAATAVTTIPSDDCVVRVGEVQRVIIQRTLSSLTINTITIATTDPALKLTWTDLKAAADSTKVQVTPYVHAPEFDTSGKREAGGAGARAGGITTIIGSSPSPFSAEMHDISSEIETAMKDYRCEKNLSVFLINEHKKIWGIVDDLTTPTTFKGIPIDAFYVSDRQPSGHSDHDKHFLSWMIKPEWSNFLYAVTPTDFDPLLEL